MNKTKKIKYGFLGLLLVAGALTAENRHLSGYQLVATKWYLNPDGRWVTVVKAVNARSKVDITSSDGVVIDMAYWAYNSGNTVKIITPTPESITVTARSREGNKSLIIPPPNQQYTKPQQLTATAVGPHLVTLGLAWLGANNIQQYQIWRQSNATKPRLIGYISGNTTTFEDGSVLPNTTYQYRVYAITNKQALSQVNLNVATPPLLHPKSLDAIRGKGIIIYIDPDDPSSPFYYKKLTPQDIVADSTKLGFRYIQLRTVYGSYSHFNDKSLLNWLGNLLDLAAQNHIYVISWSIPRHDLTVAVAEDISVASFKSPQGNTFAGCALDLETGNDYMGNLPQAKTQMVNYIRIFRKAVGPNYLISAIVFTPYVTGYNNNTYPYAELAESADVMQPMVFWHHFFVRSRHVYTNQEVAQYIVNSVVMTKQMAGKDIPVNIIGQSIDLGNTGMPTQQEIFVAMQAANSAFAIGVSFFAWNNALIANNNDLSNQAEAIQNFQW